MVSNTAKTDLLIIPCDCNTYFGKLATAAAHTLNHLEGIPVLQFQLPAKAANLIENIPPSAQTIVVDGCDKQCAMKALEELKMQYQFYLLLTDLGIDQKDEDKITEEDLQLAVDAIVALSTPVSYTTPRLPGGCCC